MLLRQRATGGGQPSRITSPFRVLVFPGGTESGLEIWRSLRWDRHVELFSAGANVSSHAPYVFRRHFIVPFVDEAGWLASLNRLVSRERIDLIYPAHDDVIVALVENETRIRAKIVTSPKSTCLTCRYKSATYRKLAGRLPVPNTFPADKVPQFPVFVKPDRGQGSRDSRRVDSLTELVSTIATNSSRYLISEYLPGEEFTVDCLTDHHGRLRYAAGRRRYRIRNGIAVDTEIVDRPEFRRYAAAINRALPLRGAWFFQLKENAQGRLTLLEVAPRVAGSMAADRVMGVNLPLLSLYVAIGLDIEIMVNPGKVRMDRALTNRFRHNIAVSHVYVDLDDTLIVRGRVNGELVRYLHQCVDNKVPLSLLTRHAANVDKTLRPYGLSGLFDEIINIGPSKAKWRFIRRRPGAIFIDDSFSERRAVARSTHILTFDPSMVELLLDERV